MIAFFKVSLSPSLFLFVKNAKYLACVDEASPMHRHKGLGRKERKEMEAVISDVGVSGFFFSVLDLIQRRECHKWENRNKACIKNGINLGLCKCFFCRAREGRKM